MIYVLKKIPGPMRRLAVVAFVGCVVATGVINSRGVSASDDNQHSTKQAFQQPKDWKQAEGWFTPTPRIAEIAGDKGLEIANALPLPRPRPSTPGFYYELVRAQGDGEGNYVLIERQCVPNVDMPEPCYLPERGRRDFPLRRE